MRREVGEFLDWPIGRLNSGQGGGHGSGDDEREEREGCGGLLGGDQRRRG